ncbi:MAG: thioesterase family protein [Lutibacter sp.]|uniref:acyl-CoA thioesterase n=1 Tax=Lutibacter sp. TaxID=1925666 RepID=UPI00385E4D30
MKKTNKFSFVLKVRKEDIDNLNHVNNIRYIEWVQMAAEKHWEFITNSNLEAQIVWVVLRHEIDYFISAKLNDTITVNTWIGDSYGVKSERFVDIFKEDKLLAKAKTIWCLLDKKTMKPIRIPLNILEILEAKNN